MVTFLIDSRTAMDAGIPAEQSCVCGQLDSENFDDTYGKACLVFGRTLCPARHTFANIVTDSYTMTCQNGMQSA